MFGPTRGIAISKTFGEHDTAALGATLAVGSLGAAALPAVIGVRGGVIPVNNAYTIGVLPDEVRGTAWGFLRTAFFVATAGASTVVGALADRGLFDEAFLALAALTGLAAVVYCWLPPRS